MFRETCFIKRLIESLFGYLIHTELQVFNLGNQSILFKFHEHLLLDRRIVFVAQLCVLRGQLFMLFLLLGLVIGKLLFLLLDATMVNLLEVTLFT